MRRNGFLMIVLAAALSGLAPVAAQTPSSGSVPSYAKLSDETIASFKADPSSLLAANPSGGPKLAKMARDLVLNDPSLVDAMVSLAQTASSAQAAAIGKGLAAAARMLVVVNPAAAARIQAAVAQSGVAGMVAAFQSASNTPATSSIAASGSAGGLPSSSSGSSGSGASPSSSSGSSPGSTSGSSPGTTNSASGFTSSGTSPSSGSGGLTSAIIQSTSPSRSSI